MDINLGLMDLKKAKNNSDAQKKRPVYELPGQKREPPEEVML